MHDDAYIARRSENNSNVSCMTISGGRTKQLDIFCRVTGFTSDFLNFILCGTYSVLLRSPSNVNFNWILKCHLTVLDQICVGVDGCYLIGYCIWIWLDQILPDHMFPRVHETSH